MAGSATAMTARGRGRAVIQATAGTQTVAIRAESLPPYWVPTAGVTVTVPGAPGGSPAPGPAAHRRQPAERLRRLWRQPDDRRGLEHGRRLPRPPPGPARGLLRPGLRGQRRARRHLQHHGRGTHPGGDEPRAAGLHPHPLRHERLERPALPAQARRPSATRSTTSRTIVEYVKRSRSYPVLATLPPTNPALAPQERTAVERRSSTPSSRASPRAKERSWRTCSRPFRPRSRATFPATSPTTSIPTTRATP